MRFHLQRFTYVIRLMPSVILALLQYSIPSQGASISTHSRISISHLETSAKVSKRDHNTTSINRPQIGLHHWTLAKKHTDIEEFRIYYNLTIVESIPQDAALMPSWPQALVQYILINPPINCWSSRRNVINGELVSKSVITPFNILQLVLSPFMFIAWVIAFAMTESNVATGGWMSVLGWVMWFDLFQFYGVLAFIPFAFQWPASLALTIQRWHGGLGSVAYEVTNLNGCTPYEGLNYLQQGARSYQFRIIQTITFSLASVSGASCFGNPDQMAASMVLPVLTELIFTAVVASKGTPMVVSGNCLLVELSPRNGFLDSQISTRWKAFSSFMGF